jgi:multidrug efflux pump subunit AcrB
MGFIKYSLKSPLTVMVCVIVLVVMGVYSLFSLPVQLVPDMDKAQIFIRTDWPGASPYEVESELLEPQERVLRGIPELEKFDAVARTGSGWITLHFKSHANMQSAMLAVLSRMNRMEALPVEASPPMVFPGGTGDAGTSLFTLFFQTLPGNEKHINEYQHFFNDMIRPRLESVAGVSEVIGLEISSVQQLQVKFDPFKAAEMGVSIEDLITLLEDNNNVSGGMIEIGKRQMMLRYHGRKSLDQLSNLVVQWRDGSPIYLHDVAKVQLAQSDNTLIDMQNGNPAYFVRLNRVRGVNLLDSIVAVEAEVDVLNKEVLEPMKLSLQPSFDPALFIKSGINTVIFGLVFGIVLAIIVLWLFLRNWRVTLMIAVAIPISFTASFIFLLILGKSVNLISLAALSFASGIVLDAAIVVLESILSHREKGQSRHLAAERGTLVVGGAILASSVTTVAVFIPILFLHDTAGQLLMDLAVTLCVTVTMSALTAVTVLPLMTKYWLKTQPRTEGDNQRWKNISHRIMQVTDSKQRRVFVITTLLTLPIVLSIWLMPPLDFLPQVNRLMINAVAPLAGGSNLETMQQEVVDVLNERLLPHYQGSEEPKITNFYTGVMNGYLFLGVRAQKQEDAESIIDLLNNNILKNLPGLSFYPPRQEQLFSFAASGVLVVGRYVNVQLQGASDEQLRAAAREGMAKIQQFIPGATVYPQPSLDFSQPELQVLPNEENMGRHVISHKEMANAVRAFGDGLYLGEYYVNDHKVDIMLQAEKWQSRESLTAMPIVKSDDTSVVLGELASINYGMGPDAISRINGVRTITLTVTPPDNISLDQTINLLKENVEPAIKDKLPLLGSVSYGGHANDLEKTASELLVNFGVAAFLLLLLLTMMLKSLKDSLLVLISVPLSIVGGIVALDIANLFITQRLDLITFVGFFVLLGLVVNNAILLLHRTRLFQLDGMSIDEAVGEALADRLRPIFSSSLTTLLGMAPLVFMPGETSNVYRGMAMIIAGGMSSSLIFTLFLIPALLRSFGGKAIHKPRLDIAA